MNEKKALLVVSFGTSYNETREKTIGAIESTISAEFHDYALRRAFTSGMIIKKIKDRDGTEVDDAAQAMERLANEGYKEVVIQPTHIINGDEYDKMRSLTAPYESLFTSVKYGRPLLTSNEDYERVVKAIADNVPIINDKSCAVVFMGHGTEHFANATYAALDYRFKAMGYNNAFVGTVEGYPELDEIKTELTKYKPKRVVLIPLMIVAGDHVLNDMASDEAGSWKTQLEGEGYNVECIIKGLGEYKEIRDIFAEHCKKAVDEG